MALLAGLSRRRKVVKCALPIPFAARRAPLPSAQARLSRSTVAFVTASACKLVALWAPTAAAQSAASSSPAGRESWPTSPRSARAGSTAACHAAARSPVAGGRRYPLRSLTCWTARIAPSAPQHGSVDGRSLMPRCMRPVLVEAAWSPPTICQTRRSATRRRSAKLFGH